MKSKKVQRSYVVVVGPDREVLEKGGKAVLFTASSAQDAAEQFYKSRGGYGGDWDIRRAKPEERLMAAIGIGRVKCDECGKNITADRAVTTAHRVVGEGIDVTGGPRENYCTACASAKIYQLRGIISDLYNGASAAPATR